MNRFLLAVCAGIMAAPMAMAQVTDADLAQDDVVTTSVLTNGMGRHMQRYSPLEQINKDTVQNLFPAWSFSFGGERQRG
ncbi:MAG: PQQ-dependent dehydrogenase, methanol/ethanol family, partial [Rhodobacteraceae bacterium]|nr:PQQ-dependent dehydrogenase, methanol/ethanol family [Paracoccaceae bacterium]